MKNDGKTKPKKVKTERRKEDNKIARKTKRKQRYKKEELEKSNSSFYVLQNVLTKLAASTSVTTAAATY